nr:hypothetical protein [Escherichia coli]
MNGRISKRLAIAPESSANAGMLLAASVIRSGKGTIGRIIQALVGDEAYAGITLEGLASDAVL